MDARRRRLDSAHRSNAQRPLIAAALLVASALVAASCGAFSNADETTSTIEVDRENREEGDVEGQIGDTLEVYDLEASVTSVERVASYSELDSRGYIEATISMTNPTNRSIDYDRTDWKLEKPDGESSNTANVGAVTQIEDDTIPAGETVEGTVIYTAGDLEGQFAITFSPASLRPEDELAVERGVWVFESSPEDAG